MAQYGVGTANPYDLLDEDAPAKKVEKEKAPEPAKPAAPAKAPEQSRTLDASNKRGGAFPRGRGRGGRGRGFGRGGMGMGNRPPRRMFERHSGTGRGKEVRKGGYGGYDAEGTMQDDLQAGEVTKELTLEDAKPAVPADAAAAAAVAGAAAPAPAEQKVEETEEEKKEREEREKEAARDAAMLTLDQYREQQKKKAVEDDAKLQTRQVQIDEKKFKACKALEKSDDDGYGDILGSTTLEAGEGKKKEGKAKKVKHLDEVLKELGGPQPQARSAPSSDFRGGRGGRGRGGFGAPRGGFGGPRGGFGGPRGGFGRGRAAGAPPMQPVDVKSESDFPKLGK